MDEADDGGSGEVMDGVGSKTEGGKNWGGIGRGRSRGRCKEGDKRGIPLILQNVRFQSSSHWNGGFRRERGGRKRRRKEGQGGGRKAKEHVLCDRDSYPFISSSGRLKPRGTGLGRLLLGLMHK